MTRPLVFSPAQARPQNSGLVDARTLLILFLLLTSLSAADPDVVTAKQKPNHCGPASAETIVRHYGLDEPGLSQSYLGLFHDARLAEYVHRHPGSDIREHLYPDFKETYQPLLAEMLIDYGFAVLSFRTSYDSSTGGVDPEVARKVLAELRRGHLAILHIPGHYLVLSGYDPDREVVTFQDPARPEQSFTAPLKKFLDAGASWHNKPNGKPRPGWDGRVLVFWPTRTPLNRPDVCPLCQRPTPGQTYVYCRKCRVLIDRRPNSQTQQALDAIARATADFHQTRVQAGKLKKPPKVLPSAWREALLHYPLSGPPILTLHRVAEQQKLDLSALSLADLEQLVCAPDWKAVLRNKLGL